MVVETSLCPSNLNGTNILPAFKQVGGKAVAECMPADAVEEFGPGGGEGGSAGVHARGGIVEKRAAGSKRKICRAVVGFRLIALDV